MNRLLTGILLVSASWMLAACGGGGSTVELDIEPPVLGLLKQVSDPAELELSIKSGLTEMRSPEVIADAQLAVPSGGFTGTYTQEASVDEFDAVRYNGSHLFIAPRRYFHCCFVTAVCARQSDPMLNHLPDGC